MTNKYFLPLHKSLKFQIYNLNYTYLVLIPKFHKQRNTFRTPTIGYDSYSNMASHVYKYFTQSCH